MEDENEDGFFAKTKDTFKQAGAMLLTPAGQVGAASAAITGVVLWKVGCKVVGWIRKDKGEG